MRLPVAAALLALAACPARAEGAEPVIALRLGAASAFGSAAADVPVSDEVRLQFPVQLDLLGRFGRASAGAYGSWGIARSGNCEGSCASVARAGLQATWTFGPWHGAEPWSGIGAGWEWAKERAHGVKTSWRGWELAAQGGLEWQVAPRVAVGPFLLLGAGRYTDVALDTGFGSASAELARRAVHVWLHGGVRARLSVGGEG